MVGRNVYKNCQIESIWKQLPDSIHWHNVKLVIRKEDGECYEVNFKYDLERMESIVSGKAHIAYFGFGMQNIDIYMEGAEQVVIDHSPVDGIDTLLYIPMKDYLKVLEALK